MGILLNADSESESLGWGLRYNISGKLSDDADAAGLYRSAGL